MADWKKLAKSLSDLIEITRITEKVSTKVHGLLDKAEIFRNVIEEFLKSNNYTANIYLLTNGGSKLTLSETSLPEEILNTGEWTIEQQFKNQIIELDESSIYRQVVEEGKTIQVQFSDILQEFFPKAQSNVLVKIPDCKKKTSILTPLFQRGKIIGALSVSSNELTDYFIPSVKNFTHHITSALDLASEQIESKKSKEELKHAMDKLRKAIGGIIRVIAFMVETKDPYTAGHQRRVANLARSIANEIGISKDLIDGIRMAGVIHDLGKISIPTEILSKPGRLNNIEFNLIKTHPQVAYDILRTIEFPWPVAQIVYQHHERMDGSGYPLGLSGKDILIEARILGVADVVEAMASHRPYRSALGIDKALEEISMHLDDLYDPEVVNACVKLFKNKDFSLEGQYNR